MNAPMPPLWSAADAASATDGMAVGDWRATGVSIDSRTVAPGDLFIALVGPNFDGHAFGAEALARGAAAIMVHRPPPGVPPDAPMLVVEDTMTGLTRLGAYARLRSSARIVAVTGSVGKTGTKEALAAALQNQGRTFATTGNLNNHWGVPLSLARMPIDAEFGVFEIGMNHAGEIRPLTRQVRPHVAIITNVEAVHIEHFSSVEAIADAKAEIFDGMDPRGVAILNRGNAHFARLVAHARTQGVGRIWSFGDHPEADARPVECSLHATASAVTALIRGETIQYALAAPGQHWVANSLAVLLAVKALHGDMVAGARALARLTPPQGRGSRQRIALAGGGFELIDESYNASPASMAAALAVLGRADAPGRRIAVLGDMLELGAQAETLHRRVRGPLLDAEIDLVFAAGPNMGTLFASLPPTLQGGWAASSAELAPQVAQAVKPGDAVMVKGSLGSRMAVVVDALLALAQDAPPAAARAAGRS